MDEPVALVILIIFLAFLGESMFGFGGGLVAIPLLSIILGVKVAITLALIFQLCMGVLIWKTYKHIAWPMVAPMTAALIIGTAVGTLALSAINPDMLRFVLAIAIIVFLGREWFFKSATISKRPSVLEGRVAGFGSGFISGLAGTGGPPLTMYMAAIETHKTVIRASLIYLFFITNVVRVSISVPQGLFTSEVLRMAALTMPFFLIAVVLGHTLHHRLSETFYRQSINTLLLISSVVLLAKVF